MSGWDERLSLKCFLDLKLERLWCDLHTRSEEGLGICSYCFLSGPKLHGCPARFSAVVARCQDLGMQRSQSLFYMDLTAREGGKGREVNRVSALQAPSL